ITLSVPFLQADDYVAFMMQDVLHLLTVTDLLGNMSRRPLPSDLNTFMQDRYRSFSDYILDRFKLKVRRFSSEPSWTRRSVSLLPCSRLWIWMKGNMHGDPEKHYKVLLNENLKTPDQIKRANQIFRLQMQNEQNFFAASLVE
uniref:Thiaminase I, tandem duplicate 1 2 n=1 Tax=Poecilia reticulata TaxID=8081 RepID=A0A3P9N873_POERE